MTVSPVSHCLLRLRAELLSSLFRKVRLTAGPLSETKRLFGRMFDAYQMVRPSAPPEHTSVTIFPTRVAIDTVSIWSASLDYPSNEPNVKKIKEKLRCEAALEKDGKRVDLNRRQTEKNTQKVKNKN